MNEFIEGFDEDQKWNIVESNLMFVIGKKDGDRWDYSVSELSQEDVMEYRIRGLFIFELKAKALVGQ